MDTPLDPTPLSKVGEKIGNSSHCPRDIILSSDGKKLKLLQCFIGQLTFKTSGYEDSTHPQCCQNKRFNGLRVHVIGHAGENSIQDENCLH